LKQLILASLITLLTFGTACGQAPEPAPEPMASDGIQVHGDWTVTVTNPDGTVDAVHEFENELTTCCFAADFLTALLIEDVNAQPDKWYISLGAIDENVDCKEEFEPNPYSSDDVRLNLPATAGRDITTAGSPASLSAVCTVEAVQDPGSPNSVIDSVSTYIKLDKGVQVWCGTGKVCTFSSAPFTNHTLQNPIEPKIDQIFSFNVILSFS
jgi:hypothetical protein